MLSLLLIVKPKSQSPYPVPQLSQIIVNVKIRMMMNLLMS